MFSQSARYKNGLTYFDDTHTIDKPRYEEMCRYRRNHLRQSDTA